jgi:shikimate kinase
MTVVLIGPPGAGKSATAPFLADFLITSCCDTDQDVERAAGKSVQDIFLEDGEEAFRALEREAVLAALRKPEQGDAAQEGDLALAGVVALGSGAVLDEQVRHALNGATVVYLAADFSAVVKHAGLDKPRIVLPGNPRGRLRAMLEERRALYESLATITVPSDGQDPRELAAEIARELKK